MSNNNTYSPNEVRQRSRSNTPVRPKDLENDLTITQNVFLWGTQQKAKSGGDYTVGTGRAWEFKGGAAAIFVQGAVYYLDVPVRVSQNQTDTRRYVVHRIRVGGLVPEAASTIRSIFSGARDIVTSFGLSLLDWDISHGKMENQPIPMHKVGHIKVVTRVHGTSFEGGSDSNFSTRARVNFISTDSVYTAIYLEYLYAKKLHQEYKTAMQNPQARAALQSLLDVRAAAEGRPPPHLRNMGQHQARAILPDMEYGFMTNYGGSPGWVKYCADRGWNRNYPPVDPRTRPPG
jgi:hypothetical protein